MVYIKGGLVYNGQMTRGILIAGNESSLLDALSGEAAKRVETFALAPIPNRFIPPGHSGALGSPGGGPSPPGGERPGEVLSWNPGSSISARTLVIGAENRLGQIDEAVLVCSPPAVYRLPENLAPGEVEILVGDQIKGWFFLVRELALMFRARRGGTLALVVPEIAPGLKDGPPDLLGPPAAAAFRAFAQGVLASPGEGNSLVLGFTASGVSLAEEEAAFAGYIFRTMEEGNRRNSGKWNKFSKFNLLNRMM
jgi:hypothetical protein